MGAALGTKDEILERLLVTFRTDGYDGASLSDLSAATGLGKSSLYHHFPGGKADMATQVLAHLARQMQRDVFVPLRSGRQPSTKLDGLLEALTAFYDKGRMACLLERLCASVDRPLFQTPLAEAFRGLLAAIEALIEEAGIPRATARERAEDAVIRIEGSLILGAALNDPAAFTRAMARIRRTLLAPAAR